MGTRVSLLYVYERRVSLSFAEGVAQEEGLCYAVMEGPLQAVFIYFLIFWFLLVFSTF